jgi:Tat protein translocase TatB subunit
MFGISFNELLIVLALALIILGPDKLPDLARSLGKGLGELKRATDDVTKSIMTDTGLKETADSLKKSLKVDTGLSRGELRKVFENIEQGRPAQPPGGLAKTEEAPSEDQPGGEEAAADPEVRPTAKVKKPAAEFVDDDAE